MNRPCLSFVLMIATFIGAVVVTASPADAQLFRRIRQARQNAAQAPQYQQQQRAQQAYQQRLQQQQLQQRIQQQQSLQNRFRTNERQAVPAPRVPQVGVPQSRVPQSRVPQAGVPAANYSTTPRVVGPVRFPTQPAIAAPEAINSQSRMPTLAEQPKKVSDNLDEAGDQESNSQESTEPGQSAGDSDLGQSILSGDESTEDTDQPEVKKSDSPAATMGLEVFQYSEPQNGVRIARIGEDSRADESGIRVGDMIVAVDRTRTRRAEDVASVLKQHSPGESLRVQFVRGSTSYVTDVPLIASKFSENKAPDKSSNSDRVTVAKPPADATDETAASSDSIKLGMLIQDNSKLRGTVVTKVRPGSIADASGLKEGDRIVSVESRLLEGGEQLRQIVGKSTWGDQLAMGVVRDGELISRKIKFAQPVETKLADSKPKTKPSADSKPSSASGLSKGIGSMLGGLFSGGSKTKEKAASKSTSKGEQVVQADAVLPAPDNLTENSLAENSEIAQSESDPLGFGDDEPIEQVIFQKNVE
ncbi:serine endoprotease [Rubripirellula obstinata]|uniref:Serine endoprotease n=1 Tax=Rubripirellula obstinata TaxID=406547 RepID=A0A5B1CCF0_9BACT|nr:PDZ domain-containing protein [Rubripirellula obstinata]KAA1257892.1 serine endoprotease [Rubripirellula obstinata]